MKYFLIAFCILFSCNAFSQQIGLGFSIKETEDSLRANNIKYDTVIEGRIVKRLTGIVAQDVMKFSISGTQVISFSKPDHVTQTAWMAKGVSKDDADYIVNELEKKIGTKAIDKSDETNKFVKGWLLKNGTCSVVFGKEIVIVTIAEL